MIFRTSSPSDIPRITELWELAFGDGGDYLDNFFQNYYQPDRVLLLEQDGVVNAMTVWFPSTFHTQISKFGKFGKFGDLRCAYLYAVATHPDCRGQGLASKLLAFCDEFLKNLGFHGVTTVPARPDLHIFFGQNNFKECFLQGEQAFLSTELPPAGENFKHLALTPVTAIEYHALREQYLSDIAHVSLDLDGVIYQAGASKLSGGGFYRLEDRALLCLEGGEAGDCYVKEFLGDEGAIPLIPTVFSANRYFVRRPKGDWQFGMLKWLQADLNQDWDWDFRAYLGFGFD